MLVTRMKERFGPSTCTADRGYAPRIFVDHQALLSNSRLDGVIVSLAPSSRSMSSKTASERESVFLVRSHSGSTLILLNELPNSLLRKDLQ